MPIRYDKLFILLKKKGWSTYRIRKENLIGQGTLTSIRKGTGGLSHDTIGKLCALLSCQPGDIMEYVAEEPKEGAMTIDGLSAMQGSAKDMDTLGMLKAKINKYNEIVSYYEKNRPGECPYVEHVNDELEKLMLKDEATTRQFLAECEPNDFETACFGIDECAIKWKLPFVEYVEGLAEEKGWTDYSRDMIRYARSLIE